MNMAMRRKRTERRREVGGMLRPLPVPSASAQPARFNTSFQMEVETGENGCATVDKALVETALDKQFGWNDVRYSWAVRSVRVWGLGTKKDPKSGDNQMTVAVEDPDVGGSYMFVGTARGTPTLWPSVGFSYPVRLWSYYLPASSGSTFNMVRVSSNVADVAYFLLKWEVSVQFTPPCQSSVKAVMRTRD